MIILSKKSIIGCNNIYTLRLECNFSIHKKEVTHNCMQYKLTYGIIIAKHRLFQ